MPERIVNEIIVDTAKASKALADLSKKFNQYSKDLVKTAAAQDKQNQAASRARAFFDKLAGGTDKATKSQKQLTQATNQATVASRKNEQQNKKQKKAADDLGISWISVKRIFAGQIIFRVLSALTNQMRDSVGVAQELGLKLAEAITIAPGKLSLSTEGVKILGKEIRELSQSFGIDQVELATAAYQVYSNQIGNAKESTDFLRTSVDLAKATVTSTSNAVDLLSGIINAYGLEAGEAARISDILTKSVELGRFRIDDIANSFGRLTPIASQLGISIEELFAVFDTLTIKGVSPDKAITQLLAVMLKMVKPSKALTKALSEIGFNNIKTATSTLGLVGTLRALTATTDGTIESLGRMFPRVRAIQSVLSILGDEGERFDSIFKEIQETSDGVTKRFKAFILATESEEFQRNIQTIKNLFVEDFGKTFIKTINDVLESMGGIPGAADKIQNSIQLLSIALTGLALLKVATGFTAVAAGMTATSGAATILLAALSKLPLFVLAFGAAALGQSIAFLVNQFFLGGAEASRMAAEQDKLMQATKELATSISKATIIQQDSIRKSTNARLDAVLEGLRKENEAYADQNARIRFLGTEVTQDLTSELGRRLKSFEDFAKDSTNALELAAKDVAKIDDSIAKIRARTEQELFDLRIRNLSKRGQREARAARTLSLLERAKLATTKEERQELLRAAAAEASRARSGNLVKRVSDARIKALKVEQSDLRRNAVILDRMAPTINKAVTEMKALREEAKGLAEELEKAVTNLDKKKITQIGKDLLQVVKDFEKEQNKIETLLGAGFSRALTTLREGLKNALSDPQAISFKIDQALKEVQEKLDDRKISTKLFLQIAPLGGTLDTAPEEARELLLGQKEQVKRELQEFKDILVTEIPKVFKEAQLEVTKAIKEIPSLDSISDLLGLLFVPDFTETSIALDQQEQFLKGIKGVLSGIGKVLDSDEIDLDKLKNLFNTLERGADQLKGAGQEDAAKALDELRKKLQGLFNTAARAKQGGLGEVSDELIRAVDGARGLSEATDNAARGFRRIDTELGPILIRVNALGNETSNIGPKAQQGSNQAVSALQDIGPAATAQVAGVNALASALANLASQRSAAALVATGGQIPSFLAGGGPTQSRGTDTVSIQAAPGEFFVNAASTRRFIPELTAINQGRMPEARNNSQITNNSFSGDININVPPGTKVDGRTISQDIRRELRRKTSSLS